MCDQIIIFHKKVFDVKGFLRVVGGGPKPLRVLIVLEKVKHKIGFVGFVFLFLLTSHRDLSTVSVTRLGDLLHFGQLFKASGNNYFAQIAHILGNF